MHAALSQRRQDQEKVERHCSNSSNSDGDGDGNGKIQTGNIRCLHKELRKQTENNLKLKPAAEAEAEALQIQLDNEKENEKENENENENDVVVDAAFCIGKTKTGSALRCS